MAVFLSHSSKDKPAVKALAEALHARGIEVWLDAWEIAAGDDIVAKINDGLDQAGCGIIVFSKESWDSVWVRAESSYLQYACVQEGKVVIPVIVGSDEPKLPPLLRPLCRRGIDEVDAIADAILGRRGGPPRNALSDHRFEERFDVFLSYSHTEVEHVEAIANSLVDTYKMNVWFNKWMSVPGEHWQNELADGLKKSDSCAVFIGNKTPDGWFREEIQRALNLHKNNTRLHVIPVLLPGGNIEYIDNFLELRTWVNFSNGIHDSDALYLLYCGIRKISPGRKKQPHINDDEILKVVRLVLTQVSILRDEKLLDDNAVQKAQDRMIDVLCGRKFL